MALEELSLVAIMKTAMVFINETKQNKKFSLRESLFMAQPQQAIQDLKKQLVFSLYTGIHHYLISVWFQFQQDTFSRLAWERSWFLYHFPHNHHWFFMGHSVREEGVKLWIHLFVLLGWRSIKNGIFTMSTSNCLVIVYTFMHILEAGGIQILVKYSWVHTSLSAFFSLTVFSVQAQYCWKEEEDRSPAAWWQKTGWVWFWMSDLAQTFRLPQAASLGTDRQN